MSQRADIEAAWSAVTVSVLKRDPAAASAAVAAAVREGLLQTAGPAALLAVQSGMAGIAVESLIAGLRDRDWTGDDVLIELLTAVIAGTVTGRAPLAVELDTLGDVLNDQRGGYIDLRSGTVWPAELVDDGQVDGLEPFEESDPELWLDVPGEGSRDAHADMVDFTAEMTDTGARDDLAAALEGKREFRRFQAALDRHETHRVHWRVFSTERRTGRARAWLADQGYDAIP
ncbi:MAG: UPF0158 family protein [Actinobacteria bacterium]|nr:UPF0158 family protein [Actinomycetota bacterium]